MPWSGALGAVTLSLYGVFDHNDHWDRRWNYWHIARPFVGIVLAIVAYFVFITLITSTGLTPRTSAVTTSTTGTILAPTTTLARPRRGRPAGWDRARALHPAAVPAASGLVRRRRRPRRRPA